MSWWQRKRTSDDVLAIVRAELAGLVTALNSTVGDMHRQLERIDKQMAALAAVQGLRWAESWVVQGEDATAPVGMRSPLTPGPR